MKEEGYVDGVAAEGTRKARESAVETMRLVRKTMGLAGPSV